ncbi:MAG: penicillin acylase family protein, partial [Bdellovibrionota bacterium]
MNLSSAVSRRALIRSLFFAILAFITIFAAGHRYGLVPPFGPLLSPGRGVWHRVKPIYEKSSEASTLSLDALKESVEVVVDDDQIKHVFAKNDHDLYVAQGYLLASERLWEMDFLARTASGRLSEILGERTLEIDKYFRRMGLAAAAQGSAEEFERDPLTRAAVSAYAEGVNAYISQLDRKNLPLEYRLLGHEPEPWSLVKTAQLLKFMAWNLAGGSRDLQLSRSVAQLSGSEIDELFPLNIEPPEPIIPRGTKWNFTSSAPPAPLARFQPDLSRFKPVPTPDPGNGSNNWAVSGRKSTTGLPILSNDIHLSLYLPSLWYEMQLVSPTQNVYGIALPGAPGVVLGFNSKLAWGVTNAGVDVLDWYQLRFRDETKSEYLFNGQWRPVIAREETIKVRGAADVTLVQRQT